MSTIYRGENAWKNKTDVEKFYSLVCVNDDGCWEWGGSRHFLGYGEFRWAGRKGKAHRFAYEWFVGAIPTGLELDHLCRERSCVNPDHLEAVTHRENVLRGEGLAAKNILKTHCPRGHPYLGDNIRRTPANPRGRFCRQCGLDHARQQREAARAARLAP